MDFQFYLSVMRGFGNSFRSFGHFKRMDEKRSTSCKKEYIIIYMNGSLPKGGLKKE